MKNYEAILTELGIEIPEDKKDTLKTQMAENYRTKADYDKVTAKRDEYKTSLDDVQTKLDAFNDVDVNDLNKQISDLKNQIAKDKAERDAEALRSQRQATIDELLNGKKFVNDITEKAIREGIMAGLEKNDGKSAESILTSLTHDKDGNELGNIFASGGEKRPAWGAQMNNKPSAKPLTKDDIMNIRDTTARQRAIAENAHLFVPDAE